MHCVKKEEERRRRRQLLSTDPELSVLVQESENHGAGWGWGSSPSQSEELRREGYADRQSPLPHFTDPSTIPSSLGLIQCARVPAQPEHNPTLSESKVHTALPPSSRLEKERSGPGCSICQRTCGRGGGVPGLDTQGREWGRQARIPKVESGSLQLGCS